MDIVNHIENLSKNNKLNWDEYFISTALLISSRSSCERLKVVCYC